MRIGSFEGTLHFTVYAILGKHENQICPYKLFKRNEKLRACMQREIRRVTFPQNPIHTFRSITRYVYEKANDIKLRLLLSHWRPVFLRHFFS